MQGLLEPDDPTSTTYWRNVKTSFVSKIVSAYRGVFSITLVPIDLSIDSVDGLLARRASG
jgi:hypothetical protein